MWILLKVMTVRNTPALLLAFSFLTASAAWAHAVLLESKPAVRSTVHGDKADVRFRFNSRVDGSRSRLILVLPDRTSQPVAMQSQPSPDVLAATLTGLKPGDYVIRWQVLASDGHISRGEVPFTVALPAPGQ
jgi:methionine-rich copper-binding protein CopC